MGDQCRFELHVRDVALSVRGKSCRTREVARVPVQDSVKPMSVEARRDVLDPAGKVRADQHVSLPRKMCSK